MTVQARLMSAVEAMQAGDAQAALLRVEALASACPELGVVHLVRGRALLELGRFAEAVPALERAVALDPGSVEARLTLGDALHGAGRCHDAFDAHAGALERAPDSPAVQVRVASFLLEEGHVDEAESLYRAAAGHGEARGLAGLVAVHERRGALDRALETIRAHPELLETSPEAKLVAARVLCRADRPLEAVALLEALEPDALTPASRVPVLHALGDALDAAGETERAFASWARANALRGLRFDARGHAARIDALRARWRREDFARLPRAAHGDERPILVVGVPRCGSTLVEQMLSCHPGVFAAGELDDLPRLAASLDRESPASVEAAAARYRERLDTLAPGARRVVDKLPHNALFLGEIAQLLPGARVVHCARDPLDAGLSLFGRNLHATHDYATDLAAIGAFQREHGRLMAHWREHLPLPLHEVRYEALVREPEPVLRGLLGFCGLAWDPAVLRFHESRRLARTASRAQVQRPLYATSVGRARRYHRHLEPLRAALERP